MHSQVDFPIEKIPQEVLDEVGDQLKNYCVPIFALSANKPNPNLRLIGSGTLVDIEGKYYILTAAHVWHETRDAEEIGLTITEYPSYSLMRMPRTSICEACLWNDYSGEWGPDLAFLKIAPSFVSTLSAYKSFVNLSQKRLETIESPPNIEKGLWAITGIVGEQSKVFDVNEERITKAWVQGRILFSQVCRTHLESDYDFIDLSAKMNLPDVPSSFGGVSGGGLWEVGLAMDKSRKIFWDGKRNLRGVAFWQTAESDGRRTIRCHGPRSVFERGWELCRLSLGNLPS